MKCRLSMIFSVLFATHLFLCSQAGAVHFSSTLGLLEKYREIKEKLVRTDLGVPLFIKSFEEQELFSGDVYGVLNHRFETVRDLLMEPKHWCDIVTVHFNIKASTWRKSKDNYCLTFYSGQKYYQSPDKAYQLDFNFQVIAETATFLKLLMTASDGPFGTSDYRVEFEAVPIDGDKTFVHFRYIYRAGLAARMAMRFYYGTIASDKVGFTILETDSGGNTTYVGGTRGMVERNAVRYYYAIQAYLDTLPFQEEERFSKRINLWYDLTDQYRRQLFEMDKADYVQCKTKERRNQIALQRELSQPREG